MKSFKLKAFSCALAVGCSAFAGQASAAVVTFGSGVAGAPIPQMPAAVYGQANVTPTASGACPTVGSTACYQEAGVVVGIVAEPTDSGSHYHRAGLTSDRELQYHPDSSGVYVRKTDLSAFSLTSFDYLTPLASGGKFVIYGYSNAINNGLLTSNVASDPDWGNATPVATMTFADDGNGSTLNVAALNSAFNNISAFWIHYQGFPHSPTMNYLANPPADFDLRLDNITLGAAVAPPPAAVPVPGAVWLFGTGLAGLMAGRRKKAAV
ncbi:MAG: PEP-CTERM sorting domain-containing protein [Methylomonas sp.]